MTRLTFEQIDEIPYLTENQEVIPHKDVERLEQLIAKTYIPSNAKVLELGARYGTVSCVISTVLDDPKCHVAVEPDTNVLYALEYNKHTHNGQFQILHGVISRTPLKLCFDENTPYTLKNNDTSQTIPSFTLEEIQEKYNITFDCLVADCEGFLEQFIRENPNFLQQLNVVIFEEDGIERCNYNWIRQKLQENGLQPHIEKIQCIWLRPEKLPPRQMDLVWEWKPNT